VSDSIDWEVIEAADKWLDGEVSQKYKDQPLAQDWARVSKVAEELGEAISLLISSTGQNPRKEQNKPSSAVDRSEMLMEIGDIVMTGLLCIQHFTKDREGTQKVIDRQMDKMRSRIPEGYR
jgi:uncharacterized pyridoxal phosphate-containing UPF0001 family protein